MIYKFESQEERRNFGGSAFIEIAYCKLNNNYSIKRILNKHSNWNNDSLYIYNDDIDNFTENYRDIFGKCICQDLKEYDNFDPFGINYYSNDKVNYIKEKILKIKPLDYEILLEWLNECSNYNGFYILGI